MILIAHGLAQLMLNKIYHGLYNRLVHAHYVSQITRKIRGRVILAHMFGLVHDQQKCQSKQRCELT